MKLLDKNYEINDSEYNRKIKNILTSICKKNNIYKNNIDLENKKIIGLPQVFYYTDVDLEKYNFIYKCNIRSNGCEVIICSYKPSYNEGDTCINLIEDKVKVKIDLEEKKGKVKIKKELFLNDESIKWTKENIYTYTALSIAESDILIPFAIKDNNTVWGLYNMYKYGYNLLQYNYYRLKGTATDIKNVNEEMKKVSLDSDKELALESFINYNLQIEYSFINNHSKINFQTLYHCLKNIQENGFDYVYKFNEINKKYHKNKDLFKDFESHNGYFETLKILLNIDISVEDLYSLTQKCENQHFDFNTAHSFRMFYSALEKCNKIVNINQSEIKDIAIFVTKLNNLIELGCTFSENNSKALELYFDQFDAKISVNDEALIRAYKILGKKLFEEVLFYVNMKLCDRRSQQYRYYTNVHIYTLNKNDKEIVVLVKNNDLKNDNCIANIIFTENNQIIGKEKCYEFLNDFLNMEDINEELSINA